VQTLHPLRPPLGGGNLSITLLQQRLKQRRMLARKVAEYPAHPCFERRNA
jgi:hypothetical protein